MKMKKGKKEREGGDGKFNEQSKQEKCFPKSEHIFHASLSLSLSLSSTTHH